MPASDPVCVDLYAGLGGWSDGFLAEGYECIGFDVERHDYGSGGYPGQLVLQDVLTLHGRQFKDAACIVASPPCQEFSYMAMPWKRAKQIAAALRGELDEIGKLASSSSFPDGYTGSRTIAQLTALFDACFRIQREASEAAGRYIPLVVENVKGAQPWVGKAKAAYGSFFLWGDVESVGGRIVASRAVRFGADSTRAYRVALKSIGPQNENGKLYRQNINKMRDALKVPGMNFHEHEKTGKPGRSFQSAAVEGLKGFTTGLGKGHDWRQDPSGRFNSKSIARKAASAQIAKIPLDLAQYIARCFKECGSEKWTPQPAKVVGASLAPVQENLLEV